MAATRLHLITPKQPKFRAARACPDGVERIVPANTDALANTTALAGRRLR
jgi:hypothetical protein